MSAHLANLAVKIGEYESNGQKKNRYLRIGRIMPGRDGGKFILLDAAFVSMQLFALANKDRRESIVVSIFEEKDGSTGDNAGGAGAQAPPMSEGDIPF